MYISPPRPTSPTVSLHQRWQLLSLPMLVFFFLPLLALLLRSSPSALLHSLGEPVVLAAIRVSVVTTLTATLSIIVFGTPVAFLLARQNSPISRLLDTLIDLPTVLPPAVAGVALLITFGRRGLLGSWLDGFGLSIAFTQAAVVLAQVFIAAPLYIKAAALGFSSINPELEQAAALDGANGRQVFNYVILPLAWPALLSGSMMSWARAMGEFGATIIFAGNLPGRTQTMPLAIYMGFEIDLDLALTLSVLLVGFSFVVLMLVKGILQRKIDL